MPRSDVFECYTGGCMNGDDWLRCLAVEGSWTLGPFLGYFSHFICVENRKYTTRRMRVYGEKTIKNILLVTEE